MKDHYVFAYGSLIDEPSRRAGKFPVHSLLSDPLQARAHGFRQGWLTPYSGITFLGVVPDDEASASGVILHVNEEMLENIDQREEAHKAGKGVYERIEIPLDAITLTGFKGRFGNRVWVYRVAQEGLPSEQFPICQSYVDVVLRGCLKLGEKFARELVSSCKHWDSPWVNDRAHPRAARQGDPISPDDERNIDRLLSNCGILKYRRPISD